LLKPAVFQHAAHEGRTGTRHGNVNTVPDAEQHDEQNAGGDLLLYGDDSQNRCDKAEGARTGKNPITIICNAALFGLR
jgi:hypothetical protein